MYAISLYRYDVCIHSGSRGQLKIFVRETSRSPALYFPSLFLLPGRELHCIVNFSTIATVSGVRERFLLMGVVSSFLFSKSVV